MSATHAIESVELDVEAGDGHVFRLLARVPADARARLLWLPALGVAARHYLPFADALAARGIAVVLHEFRGHGSSDRRAGRARNWGYRELLAQDLPAAQAAIDARWPRLPSLIGGHSLGGQLACCHLALQPGAAQGLWLVASGAPYWRAFPAPHRWWLPLAYRFLPWLSDACGALPGHRIGFGGTEARGVIGDWSRTALSGRYAARGIETDLESRLARVEVPVHAVLLRDDWLAPASSLRFLLSKLPASTRARQTTLDAAALSARADHFAWMRAPAAVAETLCA